jgi:hypothetical protein
MDRKEFVTMANTLGFGEAADWLFDAFDEDGSGVVTIGEICAHVHRMMCAAHARDHSHAAAAPALLVHATAPTAARVLPSAA